MYREELTKKGIIKKLFKRFEQHLRECGQIGNEGKIVDASFVDVPKQRNSREDNAMIKAGALQQKQVAGNICEKGYRGHPLTEEQKESNRKKSKIRVRTEHIFGFITNSMQDGFKLRSIGLARTAGLVGLVNLVYNVARYEQIVRLN